MKAISNEPLRIVCTTCVRIVRVHYQDYDLPRRGYLVALECCKRIMGIVDEYRVLSARAGEGHLTLNDVRPIGPDLTETIRYLEDDLKLVTGRLEAAKWTIEAR